jgi:hypothetical protein
MLCFRVHFIRLFSLVLSTGLPVAAGPVVVLNEILAVNETGLQDEDAEYADWIELYNPSDAPVNLDAWFLTDDADELDKWTFPAVTIPTKGYLVVFASDKDRTNVVSRLHTNFKLAGDGEYLALVRPDGLTVEHALGTSYPDQSKDRSYGLVRETVALLAQGSAGRFLVPPDGSLGSTWTGTGFDDSTWTNAQAALGFDTGAGTYSSYFFTDVSNPFFDVNDSIYLRVPFAVDPGLDLESVQLDLQCDDGFKAYLNGQAVASARAPASPVWNDSATAAHADALAIAGESFALPLADLVPGGINLLAIQGLNVAPDDADPDFLLVPEIKAQVRIQSYLETPTPGEANGRGLLLSPVVAEPARGFYSNAFHVTLSTELSDAVIRYTTDFQEPGTNSPVYTAPILVSNTTILRAASFKEGYQRSPFVTHSYIYHESVLNQGNSPPGWPATWGSKTAEYEVRPNVIDDHSTEENLAFLRFLPTVSIVSEMDYLFDDDTGIYDNPKSKGEAWERSSSTEWISTQGVSGFGVNCGLRIQGGLGGGGRSYEKKSWRLMFKSAYGPSKLRFPLFPWDENAADEYDQLILRAGANDRQDYTRDEYARRSQIAMGAPTAHGVHVHVYLNGLYWGMYNLVERPAGDFAEHYFGGGDKDNWDALAHNRNNVINGDNIAWNAMINLGRSGLSDNADYQKIQGNNPDRTRNPGYPVYIDVPNHIDYMLANIYLGMGDWPGHNWYAARQRDAASTGYKFFIWDGEGAFRNGNVTGVNNGSAESYGDLRANGEFNLLFADHAHRHMFNGGVLTPDVAGARFSELSDGMEYGTVMEQARWGHTGLNSWRTRRDQKLSYLASRRDTVLGYLRDADLYPGTDAPAFNQFGGLIDTGFALGMASGNASAIYYTLDGSDPREYDSGNVRGPIYTGPLSLDYTVRVKARALGPGLDWSALTDALFVVAGDSPLRISEIMYHPREPVGVETNGASGDGDFEFIEIENTANTPIGLTNLRISGGIDFDFGSGAVQRLDPGQSVVLVSNFAAFTNRYSNWQAMHIAGDFSGSLDNDGDGFNLVDTDGNTLLSVDYSDGRGWPLSADGAGHSLVPLSFAGQGDGVLAYPGNWRASTYLDGSPGASDPPQIRDIVLNEIVAHTDVVAPPHDSNDQIELFNLGSGGIGLGDWYLSDDADDLRKWAIPATRVVPANGWIHFDEISGFHQPITEGFGLNKNGEAVYLSYLPGSALDRVVDAVLFKGQENGASWGRYTDGGSCWYRMDPTPGIANRLPTQEVVIAEIMYDPAPIGTNYTDNTRDEYIEVCNTTEMATLLQSAAGPWRLDGVKYFFPSNTTLQAGESVLVVSFDPVAEPAILAAFRTVYGLSNGTVRIFGPYDGKLGNRGERIGLERPQLPDLPDDPVSWVLLDEVIYFNQAPWPEGANETGFSIERINSQICGNFPYNWRLSPAAGGTPGSACEVPIQPVIAVDPRRLEWASIEDVPTPDQTFSVWNLGTGTLDFTVSDDQPWLVASPASGSSSEGASSSLTIHFSTETLAVGTYTALVHIASGEAENSPQSMELILRVNGRDKIAPDIVHAYTSGDPNELTCVFTEPLQAGTGPGGAENVVNYQLDHGIVVSGASLRPDGKSVSLSTTTFTPGVAYTLAVSNLLDRAIIPNAVPPGAQTPFEYIYTEPIANASTGGVVIAGTAVLLDGSLSHDEDGGPQPLTYQWDVLIAPEALVIDNAQSSIASATLNEKGTYVLRLTVFDGAASHSDEVVFMVTDEEILFPRGSNWKYHDQGATDFGTAWRMPEYDDTAWASGLAELGYGDNNEVTVLSYGPNSSRKYTTTYFRTTFVLDDISNIASLTALLRRDDGGVVYLNGEEILRDNMPAGEVQYDTRASSTVGGGNESTFFPFNLPATHLVLGTNRVAVEIHQGNSTSSDISFDLEFLANKYEIDADQDGMSDIWEALHFGGTNETGLADFDLDGFGNMLEYVAGTDPTDPGSRFVLHISEVNGQTRISFDTHSLTGLVFQVQQRVYDLEQSPQLLNAAWLPVPGFSGIIGDGQAAILTELPGGTPRYYRARVRID